MGTPNERPETPHGASSMTLYLLRAQARKRSGSVWSRSLPSQLCDHLAALHGGRASVPLPGPGGHRRDILLISSKSHLQKLDNRCLKKMKN